MSLEQGLEPKSACEIGVHNPLEATAAFSHWRTLLMLFSFLMSFYSSIKAHLKSHLLSEAFPDATHLNASVLLELFTHHSPCLRHSSIQPADLLSP